MQLIESLESVRLGLSKFLPVVIFRYIRLMLLTRMDVHCCYRSVYIQFTLQENLYAASFIDYNSNDVSDALLAMLF